MILYSWAGRALQMDAQHARPSKQYGPNLFDETNQPLVKNVSNVDSAGTPLQSRGGRRTGSHTGSTGNGGTITHADRFIGFLETTSTDAVRVKETKRISGVIKQYSRVLLSVCTSTAVVVNTRLAANAQQRRHRE
jgi:hypothetical protein